MGRAGRSPPSTSSLPRPCTVSSRGGAQEPAGRGGDGELTCPGAMAGGARSSGGGGGSPPQGGARSASWSRLVMSVRDWRRDTAFAGAGGRAGSAPPGRSSGRSPSASSPSAPPPSSAAAPAAGSASTSMPRGGRRARGFETSLSSLFSFFFEFPEQARNARDGRGLWREGGRGKFLYLRNASSPPHVVVLATTTTTTTACSASSRLRNFSLLFAFFFEFPEQARNARDGRVRRWGPGRGPRGGSAGWSPTARGTRCSSAWPAWPR